MKSSRRGRNAGRGEQDDILQASKAGGSAKSAISTKPSMSDEDVKEAERKRARIEENLWAIEKQIYDIETRYLEQANLRGNAVRGYEGFLNPAAGRMRRSAIKQDDRLFSNSSVTGAQHLVGQGQT